jgi:N-methylhydantoinase A/oxoprolinase/acetone carboxylase beta subunit
VEEFEKEHTRHFGHAFSGKVPVEIVTLRLRLKGFPLAEGFRIEKGEQAFSPFETQVYTEKGAVSVPVVDWNSFKVGDVLEGPMIVVESFTTVWVEEGFRGSIGENYTLILEKKE